MEIAGLTSRSESIDLSILIPIDAPSEDLADVHRQARAQLASLDLEYEFVFLVSTGSGKELETALGIRREDPERVRVLRFDRPVGEPALLAAGLETARGRTLITLPPYLDVDPAVLPSLYEAVQKGNADLAFASRPSSGPAEARSLFNRLTSWATGTRFRDVASGTRAMRREVLQEVPLYGDSQRFLPVLADRLGFSIEELPAARDPHAAAGRARPMRDYPYRALDLLSIFFLSRFTRRPLRLFGIVGSAFGATGAIILLVVGIQRILGTPLANRPILVLGTLLFGLGVQLFTIGLLGELLLFFHARNVRDYRISAIYGGEGPLRPSASPEPPAGERPPEAPAP
jgi:hypothetical protein